MDRAVDTAIRENRIVGAVVLVAKNGEVIYQRAAGLADRENATPMRADAIFRLASVTKPIVSVVIMHLVEAGLISLDDPVARWFPDFRPSLPDGAVPAITVRHLLTHTSGLSYRFQEPGGGEYDTLQISDGLDQPGLSLAENMQRLSRTSLKFQPGSDWLYSLGLDLLGGIAEKASGETLPALTARVVTSPLGLSDTAFHVVDQKRLVTPYFNTENGPARMTDGVAVPQESSALSFAPSRIFHPLSYPSGGAGMAGTAGDILAFFEAVRRGGSRFLQPDTVKVMMTDQLGSHVQTGQPGWGFGYGWAVLADPRVANTPQAPGTIQWGGAYGHSWFVDPVRQLSVVALTNTAFEGVSGQFVTDVRDAAYKLG